jgi:hypothetical protein
MGEAIFLMAKLFPVLGSLLIGFVGVGVNCYIAHRDLDRILSNFKNSSVINYYGAMFQSKSFFFALHIGLYCVRWCDLVWQIYP